MIPLDSPRWSTLRHAYGPAANIPELLRQLEDFPSSRGDAEPWFTLWSSLCHQNDVYPASFAAVPHMIRVLAGDPVRADRCFFQLPACIEVSRARHGIEVSDDLRGPYFEALVRLPALVGEAASRTWDADLLCAALSAIAAARGFASVAEAALELNPETADRFLEWFFKQ